MNCSAEDTYTLDKLIDSMIEVECQKIYLPCTQLGTHVASH